ncbi:MAG: TlpA family protein disulfide reductase [Pseudomonadales bacterium]|nr:TlpA family protein disulfide reductase [Pseudomonadales bacterium]
MRNDMVKTLSAFLLLFFVSVNCSAANVGDRAPDISLPHLTGESQLDLKQLKGKVVYLDFWASWCGSCRVSLPLLNELRSDLSKKGFEVVGVNVDVKPKDGIAFLEKFPVSFPVLSDPKGKTPELYRLKGMPTSYLIDKKGIIRHIHVGFKKGDMAKIEKQVLALLSEK